MAKQLNTTDALALEALRERVCLLDERIGALGRHL